MNVWDLFKINGHVAIVTGGAQGLGLQAAEALAEAGAKVVITSRMLAKAEAAARYVCWTEDRGAVVEMKIFQKCDDS